MEQSINKTLFYLLLISCILILLGIFLNKTAHAQEHDYGDILTSNEQALVSEVESEYLQPSERRVVRFIGDGLVESDETIEGDVVVLKGSLTIEGRVTGNVLAFFADLELEDSAVISGDVVCIDGKIWRQKGARIDGDIREKKSDLPKKQRRIKKKTKREYTFRGWDTRHWDQSRFCYEDELEGFWFDYNRVYGLTLGLNVPRPCWWHRHQRHHGLYGKIGYSFAVKRPQYQIGLQRALFRRNSFTIGGELHDLCETEDHWIIGNLENALAAFFIREDFRDYYRRKGFSFYAGQNFGRVFNIQAEFRSDEISNLDKETNWSVFGGDKKFRANPAALPSAAIDSLPWSNSNLTTWAGKLELDTRDQHKNPRRGWHIQALGERGNFSDQEEQTFERYILDIRRYQPTGWGENLNFRLRAGSSVGVLPPMYWFDLGGISTLRGYRFKAFTGDRMVLANVEYHLNPAPGDFFIFDDLDLILFVDSG
ncbi:BamA/TamA family outer membrane protein, partial [candidate division KSB1 bacterium]|nr:BamA/TamA family outer membrane protein [candidate division KSB1 bacterium]